MKKRGKKGSELQSTVKPPMVDRYHIILHDDDQTQADFVVFILMSIFDKTDQEATTIMRQTHHDGRGVAGSYPLETARSKVSAVQLLAMQKGFPFRCTIDGEVSAASNRIAPLDATAIRGCNIRGWGMTGSHARRYSAELTAQVFDAKPVVRMWRSGEGTEGFGAMYQMFNADAYRGKRVRLSAAIRTADVTGHAALCLRIDGPDSPSNNRLLAFDNMTDRPPISGTTEWSRHACVVDVPQAADAIFISNILAGRGDLYCADVRFEVVDASVPVTDMHHTHRREDTPTNLDFSGGA